ncbi:MAG TPA: hypothetical protein VF680_06300 [Allosphingosinicella sp.]|jgi:hypothetical protein
MDVIVFLDQALELAAALRRFGKEGKTGKKRWARAADGKSPSPSGEGLGRGR